MIQRILSILKRPLYLFLIATVLFAGWGAFSYYGNSKKLPYELTAVAKGDISQEVSVTGRVKPAENVDLAFERSGKIASVSVRVGSNVSAGQTLASLSNADLAAQLTQARASLQKEQAELDQLRAGTRVEDLQVYETAVINAQNNLSDAESKAATDLVNLYDGVRDVISDAYNKADDALNKQSADIFSNRMTNPNIIFYTSSQAEISAEQGMIAGQDALENIGSTLFSLGTSQSSLDSALASVESKMQTIQNSLNSFSEALNNAQNLTDSVLSTYKYNVNLGRTNITNSLSSINSKKQAIAAQKITSSNAINAAKNSLATAQDQLALKRAGTAAQDIQSQEAQVRYAQANVDNYAAQLAKTVIYSPISGVVTRQDLKVGQIVNANTAVVSVMSAAQFEIEANVPEADIAKIKIGDPAKITLDTYGNGVVFEAKVVEVEPAETLIEGVATYKTTLQFNNEDERIKSGMTANIDIMTAQKTGVLTIPQRAMVQRGTERFVQLFMGGEQLQEQRIEIGLKGSDGNMEVLSGLKEGDQIASFGELKK